MPKKPTLPSTSSILELQASLAKKEQAVAKLERDLEIEASLERIRSRSMAMHDTKELVEVAATVYEELKRLGIVNFTSSGFHIIDENTNTQSVSNYHIDLKQLTRFAMPLTGDDVLDARYAAWKKRVPVYEQKVGGSTLKKHLKFLFARQTSTADEVASMDDIPDPTHFYFGNFSKGYIHILATTALSDDQQLILERFAKVFEQTYNRFLDLQKAEAQVKEAQVEAALERVRARTMAMQHSDELTPTASLLFQELQTLNIIPWAFGFNLWVPDQIATEAWSSSGSPDISWKMIVPHDVDPTLAAIYQARSKNIPFYRATLEGESLRAHLEYMGSLSEVDEVLGKMEASSIETPSQFNIYAGYFDGGYILIVLNNSSYEAGTLVSRFAKAFEQTYTRFLDLKKAEAQAREAEIQLSLERVRARTMAMHHSNELSEAATLLFQQVFALGFDPIACAFIIMNEKDKTGQVFISADGSIIPQSFQHPYSGDPAQEKIFRAWQNGDSYAIIDLEGKPLKTHLEFIAKAMPVHAMLKSSGKPQPKRLVIQTFNFQHGFLGVNFLTPQEEAIPILERFAKVFEQTYTRFLDLQKAEAQAREAQIEAALERVRSRSMAMQHSRELLECAQLLFQQFQGLGIELQSCGFTLMEKDSKIGKQYLSLDGSLFPESIPTRFDEEKYLKKAYLAWTKNEHQLVLDIQGEELSKHLEYHLNFFKDLKSFSSLLSSANRIRKNELPLKRMVVHHAYFSHGCLFLSHNQPMKDLDILLRFAKVFEQTYIRFLDLQKSEAQAREAEIELALERVRAKSMEMHHSADLKEVVAVLYEQINRLKIAAWGSGIIIFNEPENYQELWLSTDAKDIHPSSYKIYGQEHRHIKELWRIWKKQLENQHIDLVGPVKEDYDNYAFTKTELKHLPANTIKAIRSMPDSYVSFAWMKCGLLALYDATSSLSSASFVIMRRFAKVFDQAYTRFLDLQKAEAQAREAEIQLSLERVRARAMALHKSEDLKEVIAIIYQQLTGLGLKLHDANIVIEDKKTQEFTFWGSGLGGVDMPPKFTVPFIDHEIIHKVIYSWDRKSGYHDYLLKGKEFKKYWQLLLANSVFKDAPKEYVEAGMSVGRINLSQLVINHGFLEVSSDEKLSANDVAILKRFASVVDLTYTRFDDLQKAEAQAREAEIQLALERVRARTMAMQQSDELQEVINKLFQEFQGLHIDIDTSFIITKFDTDKNKGLNIWVTNEEDSYAQEVWVPYLKNNPPQVKWYQALTTGQEFYTGEFSKKEKNTYFRYAFRHSPQLSELSDERKKLILDGSGWIWSAVILSDVALCIQRYNSSPFSEEENNLLRRFASELNQTYTRFLDLKKAEAQAREAQIEVALERVRSRSMAMHESQELREVISCVFEELQKLDFVAPACSLIFYQEDRSAVHWFAGFTEGAYPQSYTIPYIDIPYYTDLLKAWDQGSEYEEFIMEGQAKVDYAKWLLTETDFKDLPTEFIEGSGMQTPAPLYFADAYNKYGMLEIIGNESLPEDMANIAKRMSRVFEQTYTRFLDLKKAETQAREAQIEAALERVRARTMAMHNSEDVGKCVVEMFAELTALGVDEGTRFGIGILNHDNENNQLWTTLKIGKEVNLHIGHLDMTSHPLLKSARKAWKAQVPLHKYVLEGGDLLDYYQMLNNAPDYKIRIPIEKLPEREFHYGFIFDHGFFYAFSPHEFHQDLVRIVQRFSSLFGQTYQRYLDLVKAEGQAREAEIELALERVRARTMAMQHSGELTEASEVLDQQVRALGIETWGCAFHIYADDVEGDYEWFSSREGKLPFYKTPRKKFFQKFYEIGQRGETFHIEEFSGKSGKAHYDFLMTIPGLGDALKAQVAAGVALPASQIDHIAFFKYGYLLFITYKPVPGAHEVFQRFAKVFEQTYTRFLDLQKAEAQAREAQIEAALERVRARTMGMHKSDELREVVNVFFEQLHPFGLGKWGFQLRIAKEDKSGFFAWLSTPAQRVLPERYSIPTLDHWVLKKYWSIYEHQVAYDTIEIKGEDKSTFDRLIFDKSDLKHLPKNVKKNILNDKYVLFSCASMQYGILEAIDTEDIGESNVDILKRFAKVFEQTYTRFLDLQKAEAQARESEIEAALERVRSKALAMHNSADITTTAGIFFSELNKLGVQPIRSGIAIANEDNRKVLMYSATEGTEGDNQMLQSTAILDGHPVLKKIYDTWLSKVEYYPELKGKSLTSYYKILRQSIEVSDEQIEKAHYGYFMPFTHGILYGWAEDPIDEEEKSILRRFTGVVDLTFQRYQDLRNAEARARESQIEAAMERIRSRAIAMRTSEELMDVMIEIRRQIDSLGQLDLEASVVHLYTEGASMFESIAAVRPPGESGDIVLANVHFPVDVMEPIKQMIEMYQSKTTEYTIEFDKPLAEEWQQVMLVHAPMIAERRVGFVKNRRVSDNPEFWNFADFNGGSLLLVTHSPASEDTKEVLRKASKVFDLAYGRYKDLLRAEARARESQIDAALERIRGQVMAMKESTDLLDIVVTMRKEFLNLGHEAQYFWHMRWLPDSYEKAMTSGDGTRIGMVMELPRTIHGNVPLIANWEKSNQPTVVYAMDAETAVDYVDQMITLGDFQQIDPQAPGPDDIRHIGGLTFVMARTTHGEIGYSLPGVVENPPKEDLGVLVRFASVFDLAYRRFEDLQQAEARTKEAIKQSSLDRVRAEIASMRTAKDLETITPLIWKELIALGVPFIRCGVFIMNEEREIIHNFLSTPDGKAIAAFELPYDSPDPIAKILGHWQRNEKLIDHWDDNVSREFANTLVDNGIFKTPEQYLNALPKGGFYLHFLPFLQGMLYVGNNTQLQEEDIDLLQSLAKTFSTAYARFEDFNNLEAAKLRIENTLGELKAAQSQLVQSEKMASLGELTAGIAHEIQNPLNFVNNFSDVSRELLAEMKEELENNNIEEVMALAGDVIDNLEKILHHGKRADAIVKGMLQHSRSSTGTKEPTDINALADEYLRLAYHGLRAKDKSFNSSMQTNYDATIGKVDVLPQDLGRVILNLITNAFYVVNERAKTGEEGFAPLVTVTTKKSGNQVLISVQDNGGGIPDHIKDKIFQPFFTTKPTGQGTGLGLSLSYDIVKAHGGELKVETENGKGSEFVIQLPFV